MGQRLEDFVDVGDRVVFHKLKFRANSLLPNRRPPQKGRNNPFGKAFSNSFGAFVDYKR